MQDMCIIPLRNSRYGSRARLYPSMSGVSKWYDLRPFSVMTIDMFSLYSVIIRSLSVVSCTGFSASHENSKIALPAKESATAMYFFIDAVFMQPR